MSLFVSFVNKGRKEVRKSTNETCSKVQHLSETFFSLKLSNIVMGNSY